MSYPPSLAWAVADAKLLDDPLFKRQLEEYRVAPVRLLEYLSRHLRATEALALYDASEGYTKTVSLGSCGVVVF